MRVKQQMNMGSSPLIVCHLSGKQATSFCSSAECDVGAFCCDSCPKQGCLKSHSHGSLQLAFLDQMSPTFHMLMNEDILAQRREAALATLQKEVQQLQSALADAIAKHRLSLAARTKSMKYCPEVSNVLRAINERTTKTVTGSVMNKFMHALGTGSIFIGESDYEQWMQRQNNEVRLMMQRIGEAVTRYQERKQEDVKRSIIRADMLRKERKLEDSIMEYSLVLEADPSNAKCFHKQASNHYQLNQYEEAIRCETEALKLESDNYVYYNNRGLNYYGLGNIKQAIADFTEAIRLNSESSVLYRNRGDCYRDSNDFQKALADYKKAIELQPSNDTLYSSRAECYHRMKDYKSAIAAYTEAIQLKPNEHQYLRNRADIEYETKEFKLALADYNRALELKPDYSIALNNRGNTHFYLKNYDQAIADYTQALGLDPTNHMYYLHRAKAYRKLGNNEQAIRDIQRARQLEKSKSLPQ